MNSVASVKDRLKNKSRETGRTLQEMFTLYGLERTIYSGMGFLFTADPLFRSRRGRFAAAEKPGDLGQRSYFG